MASPSEHPSLRIAFMGTAPFAVPTLHALSGQVVAVFTPPDRPAGRGRLPRPSAVKLASLELGLPVFQPERVSRGEGLELLRGLRPDLLVVAAFGEILRPEALAVARLGAINLHASLLPRYRGAAPIQRAIMAGERMTGVTVQWMAPEMDAGDVILQHRLEIGEEEDFGSLHDRLASLGAEAAVEAVRLVRTGVAPHLPQDHGLATYAPPIGSEDLTIDWSRPADDIARLVRALSPQPGARTTRGGNLVKVLSARAVKKAACEGGIPRADSEACPGRESVASRLCGNGAPGEVTALTSDGFLVATGGPPSGGLLVLRLQPAGRKAMFAADYVKGYRLRPGDRLGA